MAAVAELDSVSAMPDFPIDPELHIRGSSPRVLRRTTEAMAFIQQMTLSRFGRTWLDVQQSFEEARDQSSAMEAVVKLELLLEAEGPAGLKGNRLPLLPFLYNIHLAPRNQVAHTRHSPGPRQHHLSESTTVNARLRGRAHGQQSARSSSSADSVSPGLW